MAKDRIFLGWSACTVGDHVKVLQCFRCLSFGHIVKPAPAKRLAVLTARRIMKLESVVSGMGLPIVLIVNWPMRVSRRTRLSILSNVIY